MTLTFTEILGFIQKLVQYLSVNQAGLQARGLNVTGWISELNGLKQDMVEVDGEQELLKTQLKSKSAEVVQATDTAYRTASTRLDTIIALVGKTSEEGKTVAKIRSEIRHGANEPDSPPPAP